MNILHGNNAWRILPGVVVVLLLVSACDAPSPKPTAALTMKPTPTA